MMIYVFGNSLLLVVVMFGFRRVVEGFLEDLRDLVCNNFYVDDGFLFCVIEEEVISFVYCIKELL